MQKLKELFEHVQSLTLDFEEMRQRVRVVERHILLPIKLLAAPFVVWMALSHLWKTEIHSHWDATMHTIYLFFLGYFMISVAWGILIWGMNDLKRWQLTSVVFAGIVTDVLFLAGLMVASKGFDSPIFWLFALWIVRSAVCLPSFSLQLSANTIIFIVYVAGGMLENWAVSADGFEREDFVESVVLRIFFLIMLSACSMGVHLAVVRQKQVREEAQEFLLRQEQIRANGRLAAEIAHQLKNPLGIINNVIYIIQRKVERGKTDIQGQIQIIREEIDRSDRIITDLMGYAKLAEGTLERLDINNELDWAASQVFPKGTQFGIQIIREYAQGLPNILMQRRHLSSRTQEKGEPSDQLNSTTPVCPSRLNSLAFRPISGISSALYNVRTSSFHFFALPMTHFHVQVSVAAKAVAYSTGFTGSRQKISMCAPV